MARKKREVQKRKKQAVPETEGVRETPGAESKPEPRKRSRSHQAESRKEDRNRQQSDLDPGTVLSENWFYQNRETLLLGLLLIYVFLLGLGTMGELFEIEWILNLPLFS